MKTILTIFIIAISFRHASSNDFKTVLKLIESRLSIKTPKELVIKPEDVKFFIFSPKNPNLTVKFDPLCRNLYLNNKFTFKYLIHDWAETSKVKYFEKMKQEYFKNRQDIYVVYVDYESIAHWNYWNTSAKVSQVGEIVAKQIKILMKRFKFETENFHLISFSLGCHIAGYTGKAILRDLNKKLGRITGLDCSLQNFNKSIDQRLNENDAKMVDVIHTDSEIFGIDIPIGKVDCYPNGGNAQPDCGIMEIIKAFGDLDPLHQIYCSHKKSYEIFIKSINNPKKYNSKKCESYLDYQTENCKSEPIPCGEHIPDDASGKYFLKT